MGRLKCYLLLRVRCCLRYFLLYLQLMLASAPLQTIKLLLDHAFKVRLLRTTLHLLSYGISHALASSAITDRRRL